ncbi:hypothetical protein [Antarcticimicrobium luteum]|uniref:Cellulose-binding protein n=1 Tax=Antarcticimicrobium luteum TaxID=2547397 RepID=A0A4R5USP7_9RHOB|nr:hypothetical protein [Antarcticimicrobium luteum]TDK42132.1 hypothetical protein E1832_18470 [Antarcticimicrobium luteum]
MTGPFRFALLLLATCLTLATAAPARESRTAPLLQPDDGTPPRPVGPVPLAIGLATVADWSAEQPFVDVMKTARPWIGHLPGQWGGAGHDDLAQAGYLDDNGWPLEIPPELGSIGTVVLTDLPQEATSLAGRYVLRFEGDGILEVGGRARNVRYGANEVRFDYAPGSGPVDIRIQRTDRKKTGDYLRNITVVKEDNLRVFEAGAVFNPDFLQVLEGFGTLRFMDWMQTNGSEQAHWADRPRVDDYTYALRGVPVEVMVDLANLLGVNPWFNMPHLADDDYVRRFATLVQGTLWPDLAAYVEFSNEVWNWQFEQAQWADRMARARWGKDNGWVQYYALRASEVAAIWSGVYGADAETRLVNVISTQTGWMGLEDNILTPSRLMREQPDRAPIASYFDAYAITGYFGHSLGRNSRAPMVREWIEDSRALAERAAEQQGLTEAARAAYVAAHQYDVATALAWAELRDGLSSGEQESTLAQLVNTLFPYHAGVAAAHRLDLIMYEGGTHLLGQGEAMEDETLTDFFIHINYSAEMGALYTELINGWQATGGKLFNVFLDVAAPSKWGSWGTLRHLSDDNPRWDAVRAFQ